MSGKGNGSWRVRLLALLGLAAGLLLAALAARPGFADNPDLPNRAVAPLIADDYTPVTPTAVPRYPPPPPPGPGYCAGGNSFGPPTPPNAFIGTLSVAGQPVPAGTLVTMTFNGKPGPSAYMEADGGFRIFYAAGGQGFDPPCINEVGSLIGILVDGRQADTGVAVGAPEAYLVFRHDFDLP